jgi:hypothetical protein
MPHSSSGGGVVWIGLANDRADLHAPTFAADEDRGLVCERGANIDNTATRRENATRVLQGIDHALMADSAERPRENDDVERAATDASLGRPRREAHAIETCTTGSRTGASDDLRIRLDRENTACAPAVRECEPSVAAADLEHTLATKPHVPPDERDLVARIGIPARVVAVEALADVAKSRLSGDRALLRSSILLTCTGERRLRRRQSRDRHAIRRRRHIRQPELVAQRDR